MVVENQVRDLCSEPMPRSVDFGRKEKRLSGLVCMQGWSTTRLEASSESTNGTVKCEKD